MFGLIFERSNKKNLRKQQLQQQQQQKQRFSLACVTDKKIARSDLPCWKRGRQTCLPSRKKKEVVLEPIIIQIAQHLLMGTPKITDRVDV